MKPRTKKLTATILGGAIVVYCSAYLLSVEVSYVTIKAVHVAVPHYHPWDSGLVHGIFCPAQLLDAELLRPAHWQDQIRG
jgi:hypothetical protein